MPTPWRATHSDLHLSGLTPSACRPDARALGGVAAGIFQIDGHGFDGGEQVRFSIGDPSPQRALPTGITAGVWYTVAATNGDPDYFALSPLLVPTSSGLGVVWVNENHIPKIDAIMAQWTSILIARAKAYKAPWYTPPTWGPMMVAKLAAPTVASVLRVPEARYSVPMIREGFLWAEERCVWLERGEPLDDGIGPIDASPTVADIGAVAGQDMPPTLWRTGTL